MGSLWKDQFSEIELKLNVEKINFRNLQVSEFSVLYQYVNYRIERMFGGGKLWRIWRITSNSPNFTPQILMPYSQTLT